MAKPGYDDPVDIKDFELPEGTSEMDIAVIRNGTWPFRVRCALAAQVWAEQQTVIFETLDLCYGPCGTLEWKDYHASVARDRWNKEHRRKAFLESARRTQLFHDAQEWERRWRLAAQGRTA